MRTMKDSGEIWLGIIPSRWAVWKLKYAAPQHRTAAVDAHSFIGLENIESGTARLLGYSKAPEGNAISAEKGDVLFGKLRPYLSKTFLANESTSCSSEFVVMRPRIVSSEFLKYITLSPSFVNQIDVSTYGTKMPRASWNYIGNLLIPVPNNQEQKAIVAYLDAHCAPIDEAIARHRTAIGKLEEYRRAVITKAVTKGLDPNADMKISGIGWIGKMPSSWRLEKLKYLCESRNGLDYKAQDVCDISDPDSVFVVRSSNIINGCIKHGDDVYINKQIPDALQLHRGDLVIVRTNGSQRLVGKCAMIDTDEKCTAGAFMLICRSIFNPYIYWVLRSELLSFHRGQFDTTTINQLSNDMLRNMLIPLPSSEQMLSIMAYLDYQCAAVDDAIDRQNQIISKLEEYRKSLIHAVVTGRIDCTEGAGE